MNIKNAVDKAAEISFKIKELEKELKPLKAEIGTYVKKTYSDDDLLNSVSVQGIKFDLTVIGAEKRADAKPEKVLNYLTEKKLGTDSLM